MSFYRRAFGLALAGTVANAAVGVCRVEAQAFEGVVAMRIATRGGQTQEAEYLARNGNVRVNLSTPAGVASVLGLAGEQKMYMLIESQHAYMEVPPPDAATVNAASNAASAAKVTHTGKKETLAGFECEHLDIATTSPNGTQHADACVTQALGRFVNPMGQMGGGVPAWQRSLLAGEMGFPLKVTTNDGTVVLEVTRIEKKRVSDTQFRIPADFNKMEMPKRP